MSEPASAPGEELLRLVLAALDDLNGGRLDAEPPPVVAAGTDLERELVARLNESFVGRRRAARKLAHIASAIDSAVHELRDRVGVTAHANADVTVSATAGESSALDLGDAARGVSAQASHLHGLIDSVADAVSNLAESGTGVTRDSDTLSGAVSDIAAASAAIAASLREIDRALGGLGSEMATTSGAVGAINDAIQRIDAGVVATSALSNEMAEAAEHGLEVVRQTAEAVESITAALAALGRSMGRLEDRSEEVSDITKLIQGIAVQLKLLALNASIQAAHAGEAGRGFAVVAREIKQLSDSTTDSTREIESVVRAIRTEIAMAGDETRLCADQAGRGLTLANSASGALDTIYAQADLIRSRVQRISDATSTQAGETANLQRAVASVVEYTERLRRTAGDRNASSQRVVGRVREISDLAYRVRAAMGEQEEATLGIVAIIEQLISVTGALESAVERQTAATDDLATAISLIYTAGRESQAAVAAMSYTGGLLEQNVAALREEVSLVTMPRPVSGGSIDVPLTLRGNGFDPVRGYSESHSNVLDCVFETLVASREGGHITPALAERWDVTSDGLVWTFHLRPGVLFHHGRELAADDVVFSLERLARMGDEAAFILAPVRGVEEFRRGETQSLDGVRAPDERTVVVELVEPIAFLLGMLALTHAGVIPRDRYESDPEGFAAHPVGTGPFRFAGADEERVVLERFEGYRDPSPPYLDRVRFDLDVTSDDSLDGVLEGRYAFTKYIPRERLPDLLADPEWRTRLLSITQPHCQYLLVNAREGRLPDARARRAVAHAIDRDRLLRAYSPEPVAVRADGLVPPSCPGYDPTLHGPAYDPVRAAALLEESGYDRSRPIDLVVTAAPWSLGDGAIAEVVSMLAEVGLSVAVRSTEDLNGTRRGGDFDLIEAGWYADYLDPDTFTYGAFHSRFGAFSGHFESPELDGLFERARSTADPDRRAEIYRAAHAKFLELCPAIVLLHRHDYVLHGRDVEGVQLYPLLPTVRPRDVWLRRAERERSHE